ncbi:MAG: putative toxin-antitoxin system toxin component, PIN family [Elusimicrobia bacterium]|nr:putative toxin-antitoxin system toxin component, PIN family [Elusimicrobiota bacterium]
MRVVLDTNILVSALISPGGPTDQLYQAWRAGRFILITSEEQLDEFRRVTRYTRLRAYIQPAVAGTMVNELRLLAEVVTELPRVDASPDPGDNFVLAMAQAGQAEYLVTGDNRDILALGHYQKTRIVTVRQMIERLEIT